ncbi:MAG TPA: hypothetical protein VF145_03415 [Chitinophagaceae bacterium]
MKQSTFAVIILLSGICACKPDNSMSDLAASLDLKRGTAISCGPPEMQLGKLDFSIEGSRESRERFILGLKLLHSFEYDEAEKVFAGIIDKEPDCAMAYWGVAMSNFHPLWTPPSEAEFQKGLKALKIARDLAGNSGREADYIMALSAYFTEGANETHRSRCLRFEQSMESLHENYSDDDEAAIFYALALTAAADPSDKSYSKQEKAGRILNQLYAEHPDHPGIIHYTIHAYDAPELAAKALPAARRYASVAPSSAHALHMPSHIFTRLGLWDEAIRSNEASVEAARCYAQQAKLEGHWDEELHGLDYLVYAHLQRGDNKAAKQYLDYLKTITKVDPVNFKVVYAFSAIPSRWVLENKRWQEAANLDIHIGNFNWRGYEWQKAIIHFTRALGRVHIGDESGASREIEQLQNIYDTLAPKDSYKAQQVQIQLGSARAWLHYLQKKDDALYLMMETASLEEKTEKHPVSPGEVVPARQLLGDMLMELGRYAQALQAYEADLTRHPNRFNSVYGAALAAQRSGNTEKAGQYYRQLLSIAVEDSQRKELREARARTR